jgi:Protein of unknown function (DUF732)
MFVRIATTAVAAAAIGLAAFAGSATANANGVDDEFLNNVDKAGIVFTSNGAAIQDAQKVCSSLASGQSGVQVARSILNGTNLTAHQAAVFVVESTYAYCPGYTDRINA